MKEFLLRMNGWARAKRAPKSDFVKTSKNKLPDLIAPVVMKILFCDSGNGLQKKIAMKNGTS